MAGVLVAWGAGRAGAPIGIRSAMLQTQREAIGAACREGTPLKIAEKVTACLEGRKDFVAIFVI